MVRLLRRLRIGTLSICNLRAASRFFFVGCEKRVCGLGWAFASEILS